MSGGTGSYGTSSYSNADLGTKLLASLTRLNDMYTNTYLTLDSSQSPYSTQAGKLQATANNLQIQLNTKHDAIETYDREYLDRKTVEKPFTFWRLRGVSTLQDWVLLIFFILYGILCAGILLLALTSSYPLYMGTVVVLSSATIGIMITATIVRFA